MSIRILLSKEYCAHGLYYECDERWHDREFTEETQLFESPPFETIEEAKVWFTPLHPDKEFISFRDFFNFNNVYVDSGILRGCPMSFLIAMNKCARFAYEDGGNVDFSNLRYGRDIHSIVDPPRYRLIH